MCAIAALVSKDGSDVSQKIGLMLQTLGHRGRDWVRFSISGCVVGAKSVDEVSFSGLRGATGLAEAHLKKWDSERDPEYPEDLFAAVDGRLYGLEEFAERQGVLFQSGTPEAEVFARAVAGNLEVGLVKAVERVLTRVDGDYAVGAFRDGRLVFGRDPLVVKPLYFGGSEICFGLASERKALWRIGIREVHPFPPGCVGELFPDGVSFHPFAKLKRSEVEPLTLEDASVRLEDALRGSLRRRLRYAGRLALSFSGGLDSSVVAKIITDLGGEVLLCVAGLEGCHDIGVAEESAEALGLEIEVCPLEIAEVGDRVPRVVYAVEEPDVMKIGAALPLFVASEAVSRRGVRVIFSGQGADELFCGYNRYLGIYDRLGYEGVAEEVWKDVTRLCEVNLQRDDASTAASGVHLETPFLDLALVRAALSFPVSLNVRGSDDRLRKHVLRKLAERLQLPREIVDMPKKAAQYGSGMDRALRRIAKDEGFSSIAEYLNGVFHEVFDLNSERDPL